MKNAALKAMLGYIEHKHGTGEWFQDETACRFHRLVELALEAPCNLATEQEPRFQIPDLQFNKQS